MFDNYGLITSNCVMNKTHKHGIRLEIFNLFKSNQLNVTIYNYHDNQIT